MFMPFTRHIDIMFNLISYCFVVSAFKENTLPSTTKHVLKKGTITTSSSPSDKSNTSS